MLDTLPYDLYHSYRSIMKRNYDFIHNRGIIEMTLMKNILGKRVIVRGSVAGVTQAEADGMVHVQLDSGDIVWEHPLNLVLESSLKRFIGKKVVVDVDEGQTAKGLVSDAFYDKDDDCIVIIFDNGRGFDLESLHDIEIIDEGSTMDLIGKRVRINDTCPYEECRGLNGEVLRKSVVGDEWILLQVDSEEMYRLAAKNTWFDIIEEDNMENTKGFLGEEVVVDGKKGLVLEENGDTLYVEFYWDMDDAGYFLKSQVALLAEENIEEPLKGIVQGSLTELQKLCTTNNIHILISKNDYQIWDTEGDDTYEMNNVDDVMEAIECLNELKKWRQV